MKNSLHLVLTLHTTKKLAAEDIFKFCCFQKQNQAVAQRVALYNFRHINIPLPAVDIDPPSAWWDDDADKSLLIGVYKHGKIYN